MRTAPQLAIWAVGYEDRVTMNTLNIWFRRMRTGMNILLRAFFLADIWLWNKSFREVSGLNLRDLANYLA
jgi:hypothetical protein